MEWATSQQALRDGLKTALHRVKDFSLSLEMTDYRSK
jgi:hypothetical protein